MQNTITSFLTFLGILFVILKITGVIDWSLIWVLLPFWIPIPVGIVFFIVAALIATIGKD